jgi:glycosyltransferase involved in cell wall biosynthesis
MKIGVYFSYIMTPQEGGGYEHINNILGELGQRHTAHEFVPVVLQKKGAVQTYSWLSSFGLNSSKAIVLFEHAFIPPLWLRMAFYFARMIGSESRKTLIQERFDLLEKTLQKRSREKGIQQLHEHRVDVLYYPLPFENYHPDFPFIATVWDVGHFGIGHFPDVSVRGIFEGRETYFRQVLTRAGKVICESEHGKRELENIYSIPSDKLVIAPMFSGVSANKYKDDSARRNWLSGKGLPDEGFLFYPAQFWPHKNHVNLLHALHAAKKQGVEVPLVLTGSDKGNLEHVKSVIRALDLEKQVHFAGFVEREEMYHLYRSALALVMPTFLGPTNIPVIEALTLGCPVVCSDFAGHREIAGEAALYVSPNEVSSIASALVELVSRPALRAELKNKALERAALQLNTPKTAADAVLAAFDDYALIRRCWNHY